MPKENEVLRDIKQAKFIEALVDKGNATGAYKAIAPHVTDSSAGTLGSRELQRVNQDDLKAICQRVGCTREAVIQSVWERLKKTKRDGDYYRGTDVLSKLTGYQTHDKQGLKEFLGQDLDLVEIIKIRVKRKDSKDLQQKEVIDIKSNNVKNEDAS